MRFVKFLSVVLAVLLLCGCNATPQHTHEYKEQMLELTCTQDSGLRYTCYCGDSYMEVEQEATGHQYEATEVAEKGDVPGYTQYTCSVCGDVYQENFEGGNLDEAAPQPTEPQPTEPKPTEPKPTEPKPTEPKPTEPKPTEPKPTEPKPTEPKPTEPKPTEPKPTEPKPTEKPVVDNGQVMHFFDDAAFIGDSVSLKLQRYQASTGVFGAATFLTAGSYSVNHAVNDTMFLSYRGQQMKPEDALAACGAKKVFILLGMNDIGLVGVDGSIENWGKFITRLRAKNPDIAIYIQSGTPIYIGGERGSLNNTNMDRYNEKLKTFAGQNNCYFIDIATTMKDANGGLKAAYCSDQYVHLTDEACVAWVSVLRNYVGG